MRPLRLGVALIAVSAALLAGCTDPSPEVTDPPETTSPENVESPSGSTEPEEPSESATEDPTATEPAPPVFGTAANTPGGVATACVPALGAPLTFSTVLTTVDAITLDNLTLEPADHAAEIEMLDAYVLPFTGGAGGLAVGDYPPADPDSARDDVGMLPLAAGETVIVGVGVTAQSPVTMTFVLTYHGTDGVERTLTAPHEMTIAETCAPASAESPES